MGFMGVLGVNEFTIQNVCSLNANLLEDMRSNNAKYWPFTQ